jgi:hypothetical protein
LGLYSTVLNTCPDLGPEFLGELQTKELESLMDTYWLATDGCLYRVEDGDAYDLELVEHEAGDFPFPHFKPVPTGRHGRLKPYRKSGTIRFTALHQGQTLEAVTYFKVGKLNAVLCKGPIFSCEMVPGQDLL